MTDKAHDYVHKGSRESALKENKPYYYTGILCKRFHDSVRKTSSGICCECLKVYTKQALEKRHTEEGKTKIAEKAKKKQDRRREMNKNYKQRCTRSYPTRLHTIAARCSKQKLLKIATWLSEDDILFIDGISKMRDRVSTCLGIKHSIDHVVPLQGRNVCGLHVPWNLRVIPARINSKKGSKHG